MTSASSTDEISRTREGVPVWDGDASTYVAYAEAAELYEQTTAYHKRCLAAPRLVAELQGAARKLVVGQPADWLSFNGGVAKLLDHLRQGLGQPKIPELTDHLHRYLCQSRRKHGETINSYVSRKMEIYLRAQQAMKRLQPVHGNKEETPRKSPTWDWSWYSANYSYPGPWWQNYNSSRTPWTREQQARDPITGREDDEDDEGETQTGRRESWQSETTWGGSDWSGGRTWDSWSWHSWSGRAGGADYTSGHAERERLPELLPDFVQGWILLQDSNLEAGERNLVITAAAGDYSTARITRELRSQFPDAEIRRRDASRKHQQSYLGSANEEDDLGTDDEGAGEMSFVAEEELTEEGMALWSEAHSEAESALAALHHARRTLKDARQRQHSVKMNRQYFKSSRGPRDDSQMVCLACGKKGHRMSNCPQGAKSNKPPEKESAPFVCYAGEPENERVTEAALGTGVPTSLAMQQGKCVVDSGATKSIGSVAALEQLMKQNLLHSGSNGVDRVDPSDRPTFNFGNSSEDQCSSTVEMQLKAGGQDGRLRVHALNVGQGPILLSIAALRSLGAIVDFKEDLICMRAVSPHKIIAMERSSTGHQLLDLSRDLFKDATTVPQAVPSLRSFVQQAAHMADE